jgi:hypothetical protein
VIVIGSSPSLWTWMAIRFFGTSGRGWYTDTRRPSGASVDAVGAQPLRVANAAATATSPARARRAPEREDAMSVF